MGILLDTHGILWGLMEPDKLGVVARARMEDTEEEIWTSAVSLYEIAQKVRTGKLPYPDELVRRFPQLLSEQGWKSLALSHRHAVQAGLYLCNHRDPFDRLLAAQAELEDLDLVTCDLSLGAFPVRCVWD